MCQGKVVTQPIFLLLVMTVQKLGVNNVFDSWAADRTGMTPGSFEILL